MAEKLRKYIFYTSSLWIKVFNLRTIISKEKNLTGRKQPFVNFSLQYSKSDLK
jgi:hypothetical protein